MAAQVTQAIRTRGIVTVRGRDIVDKLIEYLQDPFLWVDHVLNSFPRLEENFSEAVPALAEAMTRESGRAQHFISWFLLCLARDAPGLVSERDVISCAETTLCKALTGGTDAERIDICAMITLSPVCKPAIKKLRPLLAASNKDLRVCAAAALSALGAKDASIYQLIPLGLQSDEIVPLITATHALVRIGRADPIKTLAQSLVSASPNAQYAILHALRFMGRKAHWATKEVIRAIESSECPELQAIAGMALGSIASKREPAVSVLQKALRSSNWLVMHGAWEGLIEQGDVPSEAIEYFLSRLNDGDEDTRRTVARGIGRLKERGSCALPHFLARVRIEDSEEVLRAIADSIAAVGKDALPALKLLLSSKNVREGGVAVAAFVEMKREGALALGSIVADAHDPSAAKTAAIILMMMGLSAAAAIPDICKTIVETGDEELASSCVGICATAGPQAEAAIPSLIRCTTERGEALAGYAMQALWRIGTAAKVQLEAAQKSATGVGAQRIRQALAGFPIGEGAEFDDLREWDADEHLRRFLLIANVLAGSSRNGYSVRTAALVIQDKIREGLMPPLECSMDTRMFQLSVKKVQELHGDPSLIEAGTARKARLTVRGEQFRRRLASYFEWLNER